MSVNFIERNETWRPYNLSSNFIVNPFWGAIQINFDTEKLGIFKCERRIGGEWIIHPLYANFDWTLQKDDILKFRDPSEEENERNIVNNRDNDSFMFLYQEIKTVEKDDILKELKKYSENWKKINLKNNIPIICKCAHWEKETDEESSVDKIILEHYNGFQLVVDNKDERYNVLFTYNEGDVIKFDRDKAPKILSTISGEESLFVSDKNSSVWNIPLRDAFENMPLLKDEEDICSVFDNNIDFIPDAFTFKPLLDYYPYVPYGSNDGASKDNDFYYTSINFSYSEDFPNIKVEECSPRQESHDLTFEIGSPSFQDGQHFIPILIKFKKDFSNSAITHKFVEGKDYSLFDDTSFIQIKASCESNDGKYKKECFIFLSSDYKLKDNTKITLTIDDVERLFDFPKSKMIDLPVVNNTGSTILAYWSSIDESVYKNNYKVIENDKLNGYSWSKVLSKDKSFVEEQFKEDSVSGFPLLYKNDLIYFNKNNSKVYKYGLCGNWNGTWNIDKSDYLINNKYYFISKILDKNGSYTIKSDNLNKIIAFGYNEDKTNKISIFDYDFNFKYDLKLLNIDNGCFFIPFGNAICSSREQNIVKILVLRTVSNDFIEKDNSYYDVLKYKSSIGSICSITINLNYKTAEIKVIKEVLSNETSNGNECTCYYPSTNEYNFIRNGDKFYVNKLLNSDFDNDIELVEFNNRHKTDVWCFKCKKNKIIHDFKTRSVNIDGDPIETVLFLSSDSRNNNETNEYPGKVFSILKPEGEDKVYFIHKKDINVFSGSSLIVENVTSNVSPLKLFYFETKKINDSNNFTGTNKKICFINNSGIFDLDNNLIISHDNTFSDEDNVSHIDLSGVSANGGSYSYSTDCTFVYNDIIWTCFNSEKHNINGLSGKFISSKIINGLLFSLQKSNKILKIFNFGGIHPKY